MKEGLRWEPEKPAAIENVRDLFLRGVCQVRNNLEHGAKFMGADGERQRSTSLVSETGWVLAEAAKRLPGLKV